MKVWVVRDLEPLPLNSGDRRLMRAGMLSHALADAGHETVWISSSFDHYRKENRLDIVGETQVRANLRLSVLRGLGYRRNVSLARVWHNRSFARDLLKLGQSAKIRPDLIVTDIPTTEAAQVAVSLAQEWSVPSVVSIRDLWPDFFSDHLPAIIRPLAGPGLAVLRKQAQEACRGATAIIGISASYLDWGLKLAGRPAGAHDQVFPLGYSPKRLSLATARKRCIELGLPENQPIVSLVASWGATYHVELLPELAKRSPDLHFAVAGEITRPAQVAEELARLPNVTLTGWIDATDIAALLSVSRIGVLPYRQDSPQGLPNKVFEYMAYGTYQVATLGGDIENFYKETNCGLSTKGSSPAELAGLLEKLVMDPRIEAERQARIDLFEGRYSASALYGEMVRYLTDLVER